MVDACLAWKEALLEGMESLDMEAARAKFAELRKTNGALTMNTHDRHAQNAICKRPDLKSSAKGTHERDYAHGEAELQSEAQCMKTARTHGASLKT